MTTIPILHSGQIMAAMKNSIFVSVLISVLVATVSTSSVIELRRPCDIKKGVINEITVAVNSQRVTDAACGVPVSVVQFDFTANGSSSGISLCSSKYPPDSCNTGSVTANDACGCIANDTAAGIYTYKFNFVVLENQVGGTLKIIVCVNPTYPFPVDDSIFSDITFGACNKSTCPAGSACVSAGDVCVASSKSYKCICPTTHTGEHCEDYTPETKAAIGLTPVYIFVLVCIPLFFIYVCGDCCCPVVKYYTFRKCRKNMKDPRQTDVIAKGETVSHEMPQPKPGKQSKSKPRGNH